MATSDKQEDKEQSGETSTKHKMVRTAEGSIVPEFMVKDRSSDAPETALETERESDETTKTPTSAQPEAQTETSKKVSISNKSQSTEDTAKPSKIDYSSDDNGEEDEVPLEKSNKRIYIASLIVMFLIVSTVVAVFYLRTKQPAEKVEEVITEVEEVEEEVVVKEEENLTDIQLKRTEISLEVLNGSGVAGLAGETANTFEDLGYEIWEVGNADGTVGNKLYVNTKFKNKIEVLLSDVEKELDISSVSGSLKDSTASARIVLGE